jgi:hypothetical protein
LLGFASKLDSDPSIAIVVIALLYSTDDLWIFASAGDLGGPGPGGITLAYATVLDQRPNNGLPSTGVIAFNNQAQGVIADAPLLDVTLHEIGHVVSVSVLSHSAERVVSFLRDSAHYSYFSLSSGFYSLVSEPCGHRMAWQLRILLLVTTRALARRRMNTEPFLDALMPFLLKNRLEVAALTVATGRISVLLMSS